MDIKSASEIIAHLSPEQRTLVAKSMVQPIRCGGLHYDMDYRPYYQVGKVRVAPEDFVAFCRRLGEGTDG